MGLFYREYGRYNERNPTLILLHGLLGSSANWHGIARKLEANHHLIVPDLRNHGRSSHSEDVGYPSLAWDVADLIDEHGLDSVVLIGHSMGGKVAMWLALEQPEKVAKLVVVDIAPVAYPNRFDTIYAGLLAIDLNNLKQREEADAALAGYLDSVSLRQYLLQNLQQRNGEWSWRVNLDALLSGMERILSFPETSPGAQYLGAPLFIHGNESDYVLAEHSQSISRYFPYMRLRTVPGAGHWVYAEQPDAFITALTGFLGGKPQ